MSQPLTTSPSDLHIIYEDNHLIAAEKRVGQTVQPEQGKPTSLEEEVKLFLKNKYKKPGDVFLGVIHRIDMPVSGLVLFAKTSKALTRMNEIFQKREVEKFYLAKVHNRPPIEKEIITHWLRRDGKKNMTKAFDENVSKSIEAKLEYEMVEHDGKFSILKIKLLTGRKHQIRAQLAYIGCSIVGDMKYGAPSSNKNQSICLHSYELNFIHPVKNEELHLKSNLPNWIKNIY